MLSVVLKTDQAERLPIGRRSLYSKIIQHNLSGHFADFHRLVGGDGFGVQYLADADGGVGSPEGGALEGVGAGAAALVIHGHDTAAGAQHHATVGSAASVLAIFTAGLDVVAVQFAAHGEPLPFGRFSPVYHTLRRISSLFFGKT